MTITTLKTINEYGESLICIIAIDYPSSIVTSSINVVVVVVGQLTINSDGNPVTHRRGHLVVGYALWTMVDNGGQYTIML